MRPSWFSQKGRKRDRNCDAVAVGKKGHRLLAALVDGAEKGPHGAELARHWADTVLHTLAAAACCSSTDVHTRLKKEQAQLRHDFPLDIASYCMVALDLETLSTQVWHCGDCRVGLRQQTETRWLTTPHILAYQHGLPSSPSPEDQNRQTQQLTRCLNAKRFRLPEYGVFSLQPDQILLLGTDGYWQEHLEAGTPWNRLKDDASLLTLPVAPRPLPRIEQTSDANNLRHISHG